MPWYMHGGQRTTWGVISLLPPCGCQGDKLRLWDLMLNAFSLLSGPMTISSGGWKDPDGGADTEKDRAICWNEGRGLWFEYFESLRRFWITLGCLMAKVHICLWSQLLFGVVFQSLGAALLRFAYLLSTINAVCKDFISMWRGWDKSPVIVGILIISSKSARPCDCTLIKAKLFVSPGVKLGSTWHAFIPGGWGFLNCRFPRDVPFARRGWISGEGAERAWLLLEGARKPEPGCTSSSALVLSLAVLELWLKATEEGIGLFGLYFQIHHWRVSGSELRRPACWSMQHHL